MTDADNPTSWANLFAAVSKQLDSANDARRILEAAGASWPANNQMVAPVALRNVEAMSARRLAGEPLQYVVGSWGFRYLDLIVDKRVLIPRPETEQVAQVAIDLVKAMDHPVVVDLGTGSGAIALAIATEVATAHVYATDASAEALAVTQLNLDALKGQFPKISERVRLIRGSWFDAIPKVAQGQVDVIISNPPYVATEQPEDVEDVVANWEPPSALYSGADGLDDIRLIVADANKWLKPTGHLIIELAPDQAETAAILARQAGFAEVAIGVDLAGRNRWIHATKAPSV